VACGGGGDGGEVWRRVQWVLPVLEARSVFERSLGETSDVVQKEMFSLQTRGGVEAVLRPEGTAGLVRAAVASGAAARAAGGGWWSAVRATYTGPMFRYERPQRGRLRQFTQAGAELLGVGEGAAGPWADSEVVALGCGFLRRAGVAAGGREGGVELRVNTLGDAESRARFRSALTEALAPRAQELSEDSRQRLGRGAVLRVLDSKDPQDRAVLAQVDAPRLMDAALTLAARARFDALCAALASRDIAFVVDPTLVRGLDYYEHTVFEWVHAELGAVGGGGRYDHLAGEFGGPALPGIGLAFGLERVAELARALPPSAPRTVVVVPLVADAGAGAAAGVQEHAFRVATILRAAPAAPLAVVVAEPTAKLAKTLSRTAHAEAVAAVAIVGVDEVAAGSVTLKALATSRQVTCPLAGAADALIACLDPQNAARA
jgi:histidyl-tRNA synthetase